MRVINRVIKTENNKLPTLTKALNDCFYTIENNAESVKVTNFTIVRAYITDQIFNMDFHPPMTYEVLIHVTTN